MAGSNQYLTSKWLRGLCELTNEGRGELGQDAHDDEPEASTVACCSVGAAGKRNDTVVLCKDRHGRDRS